MEYNTLNIIGNKMKEISIHIEKALGKGKIGYSVVDYAMYQVPSSSRDVVEQIYKQKVEEIVYATNIYTNRRPVTKRSRSISV
tara:strand:+ start:5152 stop:5400 length:249 start_codon:yes stop_codon:yes gene_type:complete